MKPEQHLQEVLRQINGKGYKAYKKIQGEYTCKGYRLIIDHVQGDPFSTPSRIRVQVERNDSGFPPDTTGNPSRSIALRDYLTRCFHQCCRQKSTSGRGIGNSGLITIARPLQEILERSSMIIGPAFIEARFFMGLPASGRTILGDVAEEMFFRELPDIVRSSLVFSNLDPHSVYAHIETAEDSDFLRSRLMDMDLISFIADGSLLPRASGIDPSPMDQRHAIVFRSPKKLRIELDLPNKGKITGMGIPRGISLIVGGGYHGKSTLLKAIELGIYNHVPGDGRELAVTVKNAVKIRAYDGRSIACTDISPFIRNLPYGKDTVLFSTGNASGSTSQAASIMEAIEAGAAVLLLDEDTSATNFMIRDFRMQQLVRKKHEPITPFIDKVRQLYSEKGISTILVMGGSGDYFSVADHVIRMTGYLPADVTRKAQQIAREIADNRMEEGGQRFGVIRQRIPDADSFHPLQENGKMKIAPRGLREILFGTQTINCRDLEQIVEETQTRSIGYAILYAVRYMDGKRSFREVLEKVMKDLKENGLDILPPWITGDLSAFRIFELASAINRMRTLKIR
ncbi:MAG: ATPase [Desulfobacteraceae bacterium]|nr:MAG: ATPase [Desulfobacteraceae bacterium]